MDVADNLQVQRRIVGNNLRMHRTQRNGSSSRFSLSCSRKTEQGLIDFCWTFLLGSNLRGMTATILLIDDNAVQAATRQAILRRAGYSAIAVLNPQRALDQLQHGEFSTEIDLVITDHIMPGMNGSEFVRQLRQTHPKLPVLVISGLDEAEAEYESLDVRFRLKPFPPERLLATVDDLVQPALKSPSEQPVR
jgi:CheY-like chemotaxis protein